MGRFRDALSQPGLGAIAEVKRRSPSAGDLRPDADPAELAAAFEGAGASAVSVLVDERFAGTWDDLRAARARASLPLLAKGFFSTREHLETAQTSGADAVLLLLRDLDDAQARELMGVATELGLDTLVEAHDAAELARATALDAPAIGLNARDLGTFEIDRRKQLGLVAAAPRDRVVVAESGILNRAHGAAAELAGADAVLVGSALMRAPDPAARLADLLRRPYVKVCGLTREEDVAVAAEAGADFAGFVLAESPRRAAAPLPVPDTMLSVGVFVGETEVGTYDRVADRYISVPDRAGHDHEGRADQCRNSAVPSAAILDEQCSHQPGGRCLDRPGFRQRPDRWARSPKWQWKLDDQVSDDRRRNLGAVRISDPGQ